VSYPKCGSCIYWKETLKEPGAGLCRRSQPYGGLMPGPEQVCGEWVGLSQDSVGGYTVSYRDAMEAIHNQNLEDS